MSLDLYNKLPRGDAILVSSMEKYRPSCCFFFKIHYCFQWESSYCTVVKNMIKKIIAIAIGLHQPLLHGLSQLCVHVCRNATEGSPRNSLIDTLRYWFQLIICFLGPELWLLPHKLK